MTAVTVVAWARVVAVSAIAATGSFIDGLSDEAELLFVVIGLVWVPWSVLVLFAAERPGRLAINGGPVGDVVILFASQLLAPSAAEAALVGQVVVIAFAAHSGGRRFAGALALAALIGTMAVEAVQDEQRVEPALLLMFAATSVAIVLLLDRAAYLRERADATAARLQSSTEAVLARVADAVVVTDGAGRVTSANAAADRLVGAASTPLGAPCDELLGLHLEERRLSCAGGCALLDLVDGDGMGIEVWRTCEGRRQPLLANVAAVTDDAGVVVEVVHSLRDVTKLKQSEEAKTLFLATASHELKTPLTVIRGFAETMRSGALDQSQARVALDAIHRRTLELGEIVDRLLLSSRIEAGHVDLHVTDVDLAEVLVERAAAMGAARGRAVRATLAPDLGAVRGDATAIATVVDHLIDNAVKYSPDGGDITIRALAGDPVMVTFTDSGIGMDADEAKHCFERFWQAEGTDVRRFGGTGIGLYIVRSLVEAMGGRISVESERGVGSTFVVELPAAAAGGPDDDPAARRGEATMIREFMRQIGVPERAG